MKKFLIEERRKYIAPLEETKGEYEGERIEDKVSRITENNEPISDGAPIVFTKRSDGVRPEYNIRTDKWDIALDSMEKVNTAKRNKIKENMKKGLPPKTEEEQQEEQKTEKIEN